MWIIGRDPERLRQQRAQAEAVRTSLEAFCARVGSRLQARNMGRDDPGGLRDLYGDCERSPYAFRTVADTVVEALEALRFLLQMLTIQDVEHALEGTANWVVGREAVALEERIEDGTGNEMLRQHLDCLVRGDGIVQIIPDLGEKAVKGLLLLAAGRCARTAATALAAAPAGNTAVSPAPTADQAEIRRLRRELERVQMERDILKKAIGIFSGPAR